MYRVTAIISRFSPTEDLFTVGAFTLHTWYININSIVIGSVALFSLHVVACCFPLFLLVLVCADFVAGRAG